MASKKTKRCPECQGELSYCGEMTSDGPSLDCRACSLATRLRAAEADNAALKARAEAAEKVVADIDIALYPETDPYGEGDSFRADAMWDIHKIRQAARTPTPTPATGQEETR